ncbi:unnamed protein product [Cuscuta campestris]|uniref:Uncharacterized protein n=1 Tax=Cuscuta campestris TaxID=132261 RepID=A0A484K7F3_9ASTE|nr:unnamed protein product [Cuscuta campestris]
MSTENVDEVVGIGVECCVATEVEIVGVDAAGAGEVEEDDAVVPDEMRVNAPAMRTGRCPTRGLAPGFSRRCPPLER